MIGNPSSESSPAVSVLALVASNARIPKSARIGDYSVIGREDADAVEVGENTIILEHVLVGPGSVIGRDCIIEAHCRVGAGSRIADGTHLRSASAFAHNPAKHGATTVPPAAPAVSERISPHALIASNVTIGNDVEISPYAIVGMGGEAPVVLGEGTRIAPFALIEPGTTIGKRCIIDAYCRIAEGTEIGDDTQILYGAAVFENVRIGRAGIIGGNVADRTVIEDYVTYFGEIAHNYDHPGDLAAWDSVEAPSPVIRERSVVGQYALILGPRTIGPSSYVAAGEVVKVDVPSGMVYSGRKLHDISKLHGLVRTRTDGLES